MRIPFLTVFIAIGVIGTGSSAFAQRPPPCKAEGTAIGVYTITIAKDSASCSVTVDRRGSWETGKMVTPAAHGTASVTIDGSHAIFVYAPMKGYTGADMFRAEIAATRPFLHRFNVTVTP